MLSVEEKNFSAETGTVVAAQQLVQRVDYASPQYRSAASTARPARMAEVDKDEPELPIPSIVESELPEEKKTQKRFIEDGSIDKPSKKVALSSSSSISASIPVSLGMVKI